MKEIKYTFEEIEVCEMCGDSTTDHIVLGQRLNQSQGLRPKSKTGISVSVMKCRNCDLIYSQPQPIPFDIQDHYGVPAEDYWKPHEFIVPSNLCYSLLKVLEELLPLKSGMTSLDIGAGLGKTMIALEEAGFDSYGIEPSIPFYERALSKMNINPEKLKLGMVEEVEYDDESFDFINYGAVFEHLYHPAQNLEKVLKWLKPNGVIHIEVPSSHYTIAKLINLYFKLARTNYVTDLSPMHSPYHLYTFGLKSFEELGKKIGYKIEKHYYSVCEIDFVPKIFHPVMRKYMELNNSGMQLMVYLKKVK